MTFDKILSAVVFILFFSNAYTFFSPMGDEVEAGSVLLPATRRGRYLADIIRRQAVDGTGIKFNKDADRLNAEAKKIVDSLSDELLPYVSSEQERRIALHRRIIQLIQNGEHGVTIAELRGRPPLFIQRGKYYRCPSNRMPLEPDGSGVLMCTQGAKPSQVLYDSCLRAEDSPLYVVNGSTYFFCNRNRDKNAPELPRNETHMNSCHPRESTSRDYTIENCTPDQSGDVIVHYRYYANRLFTSIREFDPEGEVCDHWNPCQIGYIFSIASLDSAQPTTDFLPHLQYQDDELVKPVEDVEITVSPMTEANSEAEATAGSGGEVAGPGVSPAMGDEEVPTSAAPPPVGDDDVV